jgi:excisionase family DNA binding protein
MATSSAGELLTVEQLAKRLHTTTRNILRWSRSGRLPVIRPSRKCLRFDYDAVMAALSNGHGSKQ